jgi:hypothetical protein
MRIRGDRDRDGDGMKMGMELEGGGGGEARVSRGDVDARSSIGAR